MFYVVAIVIIIRPDLTHYFFKLENGRKSDVSPATNPITSLFDVCHLIVILVFFHMGIKKKTEHS